MRIAFTHPEWLWLLPLALAWVLWLALKSDHSLHSWRRWVAGGLRVVVTTVMVCAIAGLQWRELRDGLNIFFVLDRSDSVATSQQQVAQEWVADAVRKMPAGDRAGVVVFGSEARIESSPQPALRLDRIDAVVPGERSDLGAALRLATAAFPEYGQRRIVLVSDGNENLGDALNAAVSARAQEVSVDTAPLHSRRALDVAVQRLQTPSTVKEGQPFEVRVFVQADVAGPAMVRLLRNHQFLGEQAVNLDAGKNLLTFPQTLPEPGFYSYEVQVESANDVLPQNNRALAFTDVRGKPRVLLVSDDPPADALLAGAIRDSDALVNLIAPVAWPDTLAELQSYDSIVLCNVAAADLSRDAQARLEVAVRDFGVGLVCVGGDQTYAAGAYRGTILDRILPVDSELSSKKVLPPGALVLIIDKSGSMAGEKIEVAKQAALAAVSVLSDRDYVAVLAFDGEVYRAADIQLAGNRREIMELVAGIQPGGGTSLYPPMQLAYEMLNGVNASLKHCIILTDGQSNEGDFEGITRAMLEKRITVSTVGVGPDVDANLLLAIADLGKGQFYHATTLDIIPQVFIKETAIVLKTAISEEPFRPQLVQSSEVVRGINLASAPPLLGYVVTMPKVRAETPLLTDKGDPLLAHWQLGLGRAVAFTSDARAKWAQQWQGWAEYQRFWRQIVQWSLRRVVNPDFTTEVAVHLGEGRLSVEALDPNGDYLNFLNLRAVVLSPGGNRETVALRQTGPGRYETGFAMRDTGAYLVNLQQLEQGEVRAAQTIGASLNYSPELDTSSANLNLLRRIADVTGGQELTPADPGADPFRHDRRPSFQPRDLWRTLLQLAVLLFVVDVGIRRLQLDAELWQRVRRVIAGTVLFWRQPVAATTSDPSLAALLARRDQVRTIRPEAATSPMKQVPPLAPASPAARKSEILPEQLEASEPSPRAESPVAAPEATVADRLKAAKRRAWQKRR